jgi:hypothetical protein
MQDRSQSAKPRNSLEAIPSAALFNFGVISPQVCGFLWTFKRFTLAILDSQRSASKGSSDAFDDWRGVQSSGQGPFALR